MDDARTARFAPNPRAARRYIYRWSQSHADGDASLRDLLGGKGAGLAEMAKAGLPVPPGFTITTQACKDFFANGERLPAGLLDDVCAAVARLERDTGKKFGGTPNPLLVSVRSGAVVSMPGMMDTVLNLGLNDATLAGLIELTGDERFAWDACRRFVQMFGRIVLDVPGEAFEQEFERVKTRCGAATDTDLDAAALRELVTSCKRIVREATGREFPSDPLEQLELAIRAVFRSWLGQRARDYRRFHKISDDLGTAVNVVAMVFGNMGDTSGTGVAFTRDPNTGERRLFGEYLTNAQGEDVVAGTRTAPKIAQMRHAMPATYAEFEAIAERLERHYRDVQDLEFTIERGKLYMLQTRTAKRTAAAAVRIAVDMVAEGLITKQEALLRVDPAHVDQLLRAQFDASARAAAPRIAHGLNASPGAAVGRAVFHADDAAEWAARGERVILVRVETSPDDFHGMAVAQGVLTARGGATSHAAVVARQIGKPCIAGCADLAIDAKARTARAASSGLEFREGDWLSLDGTTGDVLAGRVPTALGRFDEQAALRTLLGWADEVRRLQVWANADEPDEAAQARLCGAQGIGLCRTEHMFREGERLAIVRSAILVAHRATRAAADRAAGKTLDPDAADALATFENAMGELERLQQRDFEGLFRAMDGLPVVVRLIDPPLHEFLPKLDEQLVKVTRAEAAGGASRDDVRLLTAIESMREQNPMLGLRGCRLGLMVPELVKTQTRAILNAQVAVKKAGGRPIAKIMIPLVGHVNELARTRELLEQEARAVERAAGTSVEYEFGTMIEVPRGALTADEIAREADFFSCGTNDLTQMTFGYCRDAAESGFLLEYVERKILPANPFQTLDDAVASLVKIAVDKGRSTKPALQVGVCGEHGGEPASIAKFEAIGLDYVSCSPSRVPAARLAAARAVLSQSMQRRASSVETASELRRAARRRTATRRLRLGEDDLPMPDMPLPAGDEARGDAAVRN
jgi:pyruvate,orthophosphate dikinase